MTKGGMQMKAATILFALLRSEVCDDALTEEGEELLKRIEDEDRPI